MKIFNIALASLVLALPTTSSAYFNTECEADVSKVYLNQESLYLTASIFGGEQFICHISTSSYTVQADNETNACAKFLTMAQLSMALGKKLSVKFRSPLDEHTLIHYTYVNGIRQLGPGVEVNSNDDLSISCDTLSEYKVYVSGEYRQRPLAWAVAIKK